MGGFADAYSIAAAMRAAKSGTTDKEVRRSAKTAGKFQADDLHSGIAQQYHKVVLKSQIPRSVGGSIMNFYHDWSRAIIAPGGYTTYTETMWVGAKTQWLTNTAGVISNGAELPVSYFEQNYNRIVSGSSLYGAATPASDRFCLRRSHNVIDVTNFGTTACFFKIHVFYCIRDCATGPLGAFSLANAAEALGVTSLANASTTDNAYYQGSYGGTYTSAPYADSLQMRVNGSFGHVRGAKVYWKKKKTVSMLLGAGATDRAKISLVHNNLKQRDVLNGQSGIYPVGTVCYVIEQTGQITLPTSFDGENPIHGSTKVGVVMKNHLSFQQVKAGTSRLETQFYVQQEPGSTGAQKQVNILDSVVNAAFV